MLCVRHCRPELLEIRSGRGGWIGVGPEGRGGEYKKAVIVSYPEFPCYYYPSNHIGLYSEFTVIGIHGYL